MTDVRVSTLQSPLLHQVIPRTWTQQFGAIRGPHPTVVLLLLAALAGCALVADQSAQSVQTSSNPSTALSLAQLPQKSFFSPREYLAAVCLLALTAILAFQFVCERLILQSLDGSLRGVFSGLVDFGDLKRAARAWPLLGKIVLRNCIVGHVSECSVQVQRVTVKLNMCKFIFSLGQNIEIMDMKVEGVTVHGCTDDQTAAQVKGIIVALEEAASGCDVPSACKQFVVRNLQIKHAMTSKIRSWSEFSQEMCVDTYADVIIALVPTITNCYAS